MGTTLPDFHFDTDIPLTIKPLVEAWLEIRWKLEPGKHENSEIDRGFPFALGAFYSSIKDEFGHQTPLPTTQIPEYLSPHLIRYQFRKQADSWPILQLGPGIATVNFTSQYSWEEFKKKSLYLRNKLVEAYVGASLDVTNLILRYRNAIAYDPATSGILDILKNKLNTSVGLSSHIPGNMAQRPWPSEFRTQLTYDLTQPKGRGIFRILTGKQRSQNQDDGVPVIILELEVQSLNEDNTCWATDDEYDVWLTSAHAIIHEWFFASIDGPLRKEYDRG